MKAEQEKTNTHKVEKNKEAIRSNPEQTQWADQKGPGLRAQNDFMEARKQPQQ